MAYELMQLVLPNTFATILLHTLLKQMHIHGELLLKTRTGEECSHTNVEVDASLGQFGCRRCRRVLLDFLTLRALTVKLVLTVKAYMKELQWCLKALFRSANDE